MTTVKKMTPQSGQPTNNNLLNMWNELNSMPMVMRHLLRSKIKEFLDNNGMRIETIQSEIRKLQDEYLVIINGAIQFQPPILDDKGQPVNPNAQPLPQLQNGKSLTEFQEKLSELMQKTTVIV